MKRFVVVFVALVGGCTLAVDLEGFAVPTAPLDAPREGGSAVVEAAAPDAAPDARPADDSGKPDVLVVVADAAPDVTSPPLTTRVSCQDPSSCGDGLGCCVVYGNSADFCTKKPVDCKFGTDRTVFMPCDDAEDCAALGSPGSICCGTIDAPGGAFLSVSCRLPDQCNGVQLCDAVTKQCPSGKTCVKDVYAAEAWSCE